MMDMFNWKGGAYGCAKLLMVLKMLKCFGDNVHQSEKAVAVSPRQQERHVSVPMEILREGVTGKVLFRAQQRRLQASRGLYLARRLSARSGALTLQLQGASCE